MGILLPLLIPFGNACIDLFPQLFSMRSSHSSCLPRYCPKVRALPLVTLCPPTLEAIPIKISSHHSSLAKKKSKKEREREEEEDYQQKKNISAQSMKKKKK